MEFFKHRTQIDFMSQRKWPAVLSTILFVLSLVSFGINGLNLGLDFTGGTQLVLSFPTSAPINAIRDTLQQAGFTEANVNSYGTSKEVSITLPNKTHAVTDEKGENAKKDAVTASVQKLFPTAKLMQADFTGSIVGKELTTKGLLAVIIALLGTMIYIAMRFEVRFAVGSTIALIHDPVLILGIFSFFHLEFNLIVLAGVLTVIGYSLNDTIVIFDRIRENFRRLRKSTPIEIINQAINQTLSRTLMTSALTLMVVVTLFFLGGQVLRGFAAALIIGIVVGTYSSIYVAGSLALALGLKRQHLLPPSKALLDGRP